jgi:hypothetical protein
MFATEGGQYNNDVNTWNDNVPSSVQTNSIVGHPQVAELNASVEYVTRNMTIRTTSRLILEDNLKIKIHDNETELKYFNVSLPTEFDQNVIKATFYAKFDTDFGLIASDNIKSFTKYIGQNITTYSVDITVNDTLANSTLDGVFVYARYETLNSINFLGIGDTQRGNFTSPIIPTYPNLEVEDALIGVRLQADQDRFNRDLMENIVVDGTNYPILRSFVLLEWRNMTRSPFDPMEGFVKDNDYTEIVFDSTIPDDPSLVQSGTVNFAFTEALRNVRIDPWGVVHITETMTMIHLGAPRPVESDYMNLNFQIVGFTMQFNEHSKVISAFDEIGRLNVGEHDEDGFPRTPPVEGGLKLFNLNFRNPIYGGESYTFTVDYEINSSRIISVEDGVFTMNTTLFSLYNTTIYDLKTVYEFPAGSTFVSTDFIPQSSSSKVSMSTVIERNTLSYFNHLELHIDIVNATHLDNFRFEIVYTYNGVGHFQYLFTFILSIFGLISVVVLLKQINLKESTAVQHEKEKIPMDEITRFFDNFSDVRGASDTINDLKAKRKAKKLSQKDYASKVKKVKIRLRNQKEVLEKATADLTKQGGRYKRLAERVVFAYKKLEDTQSNITSTNRSYAKKDVSKDLYYKLLKEYNDEVDKQESIINRSLSELNEIINQFE